MKVILFNLPEKVLITSRLCANSLHLSTATYIRCARAYEPADAGASTGKEVGRGLEESAQGKSAHQSQVCRPRVGRLHHSSDLLIDQLRAIDNRRLVEGPLTKLSIALMAQVHAALTEGLNLDQDRS